MSREFVDVEASSEEGVDANGLIDQTNYANDPKVVTKLRDEVLAQFPQIIHERSQITERIKRWEALTNGHPTVHLYDGKSRLNVPRAERVLQRHVDRLLPRLFPINEDFGMTPLDAMAQSREEPTRIILQHFMDQAKLKAEMPMFLFDGVQNGTAIMKQRWHVDKQTQYKRVASRSMEDIQNGIPMDPRLPRSHFQSEEVTTFEGPQYKTVDLLRWYIHPISARWIGDYEIIFEDLEVSTNFLIANQKTQHKPNGLCNVDKVMKLIEAGNNTDKQSEIWANRMSRRSQLGVPETTTTSRGMHVMEVWCKFPLFKYAGVDDKTRPQHTVPTKVLVASAGGEPIILGAWQNPMLTQRPPYHSWRVRHRRDMFYGRGVMELIEGLNYALNAFHNQAIDSANFSINQLAVVDILKLAIHPQDIHFAPLSVIPVRGDVNAVNFVAPPPVFQEALAMAGVIAAVMEDSASTDAANQTGRQPKSATGQSINAAIAEQFEEAAAEQLNNEMMTDMLRDAYHLGSQFLSEDAFMRLLENHPDARPMDDIQALLGDYGFRWTSGSQTKKREAMEVQLMELQVQKSQLEAMIMAMTGQQAGSSPAASNQGQPAQGPNAGLESAVRQF